jgi:GNAT superfamily N-acetyltransferase
MVSGLGAVPDCSSDPALVAVRSGQAFGLVTLHIARTVFHPAPVARITTPVVDGAARRLGIGRLLVAAAADLAKAAGCQTLELTTGLHRKKAHAFYRSLGFESTSLGMARGLEDALLPETPR